MRRRSPTSRGSRVPAGWSIAATRSRTSPASVSYQETAYLLLHGDLPNRGSSALRGADRGGLAAIPEPAGRPARADPASNPPDGRAPDLGERPGPLRPRGQRPADRPRRQRPQGRADARPDADGRRLPRADRQGLPAGPAPGRPRPLGQLPLHGHGEVPSEAMRKAFDLSLVLYAEHELNASTFSARVTVSTLSDIYSGIVAAIGTLKGSLHGGANEEAWKVLEQVGSPEKAETWIQDALARKERIMGFGHRVYKTGDPRAGILKDALHRAGRRGRRRPLGADRRADRAGRHRPEEAAAQRRLAQRPALSLHGPGDRHLHADLRHGPRRRLGGPHHRAARPQPPDAPPGQLHRPAARPVMPIDQR